MSQSAGAGQSGSAWPVSPLARPVPTTSGKLRPLRKSVVERFATLTREERERRFAGNLSGQPSTVHRPPKKKKNQSRSEADFVGK